MTALVRLVNATLPEDLCERTVPRLCSAVLAGGTALLVDIPQSDLRAMQLLVAILTSTTVALVVVGSGWVLYLRRPASEAELGDPARSASPARVSDAASASR